MAASGSAARRGVFIAFEGGDGSGKSTQARLLAASLGATLTREPGGTPVGEAIRAVALDPGTPELSARTEALLMAAARAQHVEELILPALDAGTHVVTDRFVASSLAYQGVGRGLGVSAVSAINDFARAGVEPDLTILLDVGVDEAHARLGADLDRIEAAGRRFAADANRAFREFAHADPDRWVVFDAATPIETLSQEIEATVRDRLGVA